MAFSGKDLWSSCCAKTMVATKAAWVSVVQNYQPIWFQEKCNDRIIKNLTKFQDIIGFKTSFKLFSKHSSDILYFE